MATPSKFSIALVQMSATNDPDENLKKAATMVEQAASKGARVICLPELFRSQYFCQREDAALFDRAEAGTVLIDDIGFAKLSRSSQVTAAP